MAILDFSAVQQQYVTVLLQAEVSHTKADQKLQNQDDGLGSSFRRFGATTFTCSMHFSKLFRSFAKALSSASYAKLKCSSISLMTSFLLMDNYSMLPKQELHSRVCYPGAVLRARKLFNCNRPQV